MKILLAATITTSFFDSLNPSAIAQQLLLQAMVKRKKDIVYFILGISLVNLIMGITIYYGVTDWILEALSVATKTYPLFIYGIEFIIGIAIITTVIMNENKLINDKKCVNEQIKINNFNLSRSSLFIMGGSFCIVELTSALPYFAFLAMLSTYNLSFILVLFFISFYTFVYALPLILLYIGYNKLQGTLIIQKLEYYLNKVSVYIIPVALIILSIMCILHSSYSLL